MEHHARSRRGRYPCCRRIKVLLRERDMFALEVIGQSGEVAQGHNLWGDGDYAASIFRAGAAMREAGPRHGLIDAARCWRR